MKNRKKRLGFFILVAFVGFILGQIINGSVRAAPMTDDQFGQQIEKQITQDISDILNMFIWQYQSEIEQGLNEVENLLEEIRKTRPKKEQEFEI